MKIVQEFISYFKNKKSLISLLVLAILVLALPLGLNLFRQQQTLKSSATEAPITFSGDNAEQRNGAWVVKDRTRPVTVTFTSPLGPPGVGVGSTNPTILRSVGNPSKKKVTFSFPSLVKEVYAVGGGCPDTLPPGVTDRNKFKHKETAVWYDCKNSSTSCGSNACVGVPWFCEGDGNGNWQLYDSSFVPPGPGSAGECTTICGGLCSAPPSQSCDNACGGWSAPGACGVGCLSNQKRITRNCGSRTDCETSRCNADSSCGSTGGDDTGGGSCSVSWQISPAQAAPNTNVSVTVTGENSSVSGGWSDIGLSIDNRASVGDVQITPGSRPRFIYTVGSGAQPRTNALTFSLKNGAKVCTPTGSFTTTGATATSSPAPTAPLTKECDFNGNGSYEDTDITDFWKGSFLGVPGNQAIGPDCNHDSSIDLLDFNKWRNLRWHNSEGS